MILFYILKFYWIQSFLYVVVSPILHLIHYKIVKSLLILIFRIF